MSQQAAFLVSSLAGIFPPMTEGEYSRLEESIREVGLLEEITLWQGTVIDGVHRLRVCLRLGIEPRFSCLPGDADPLTHVVGKNGLCRDLAPWQRPIADFRSPELRGRQTFRGQQALGVHSGKGFGPEQPGDTRSAEGRSPKENDRQRHGRGRRGTGRGAEERGRFGAAPQGKDRQADREHGQRGRWTV